MAENATGTGKRKHPRRDTGTRRAVHARRRALLLGAVAILAAAGVYLALSAGDSASRSGGHGASAGSGTRVGAPGRTASSSAAASARVAAPAPPPPPHLLVTAPAHPTGAWTLVARVRGAPAAWVSQRSGVTLLRFDQKLVHLTLHAGSTDGGTSGWVYGDRIGAREIHLVLAAFNGGFKLSYPGVGFSSAGHVAAPLKAGIASIVTYTDGTSDIGAWRAGVPAAHKRVFSVLQNLRLLVDRGLAASSVSGCVISCWGETVGSRTSVARSALAVTATGELLWAAGEQLEPAALAAALIRAGAVRAIELDINPDWVAGYLYVHHSSGPVATPVLPGQLGITGRLLEPYSRDFLAVIAN
ncbi:MAG: hypothetical protein QOI03_180 [Solirubrobacteraceae bacterium]|jgi:hypothetical protein|nr:hypothetical protein [Solirubrobacteraceae bacterium]